MGLENKLNSIKNLGITSLLAGSLIFNPLYVKAENLNYKWDKTEKISFISSSLLAAADAYQTANIPKDKKDGYKITKFKETNPLITSWAGNHPSDSEMFLYYTASTAAWLLACDLIPKYVTKHFIPEKYNKYTRKIMLGLGNLHYLNKVIENEQVTGGILFKKEF